MSAKTGKSPRGRPVTPHFRSRSEEKTAAFLTERGVPFAYESRKVEYVKPATKHRYIPDFELADDLLLEVKGRWLPADRQKIVLVKRQNPGIDIRLLFDNPNTPIYKGSKTTYAMFCEKNGIPWAKGPRVPDEWLPA